MHMNARPSCRTDARGLPNAGSTKQCETGSQRISDRLNFQSSFCTRRSQARRPANLHAGRMQFQQVPKSCHLNRIPLSILDRRSLARRAEALRPGDISVTECTPRLRFIAASRSGMPWSASVVTRHGTHCSTNVAARTGTISSASVVARPGTH